MMEESSNTSQQKRKIDSIEVETKNKARKLNPTENFEEKKTEKQDNPSLTLRNPQHLYIINGFYMTMRDKYTKPGAHIYYYEVEWDSAKLSWKNFRENVIGATDPTTALNGSMRREVFKKFEELGLKSVPNIGDNSIHASASPFEALCERMNWLERKLSDDEFGKALLDSGIPQDTINKWILDPQIDLEGGKMSLFDSLEDIDTDECLTKCQTIAGVNMPPVKINKNQAFIFIKPHAVTGQVKDFVAGRLAELKFTIISQGTLSSEIIEKKKIIDNHYYAIANKATFSQPKDLNVPAQKKEEFLKKFGISWESALADEVVYNAMEACNKLGINGTQLNTIWAAGKENKQIIKFGGGFYCGKVNVKNNEPISILLLGAGMVSRPLVHYLSEHGYIVHVASRTLSKIEAVVKGAINAKAIKLDIQSKEGEETMHRLVPQVSAVISLLPYVFHPKVAEYALKYNKHFFTSSYTTDTMRGFDEEAKKKNLVFINECGVDPGTDHMSAMKIINGVRSRGGKITSFTSYCGGLPAPEDNNNPLGYKLSWAPRGVLLASRNSAFFLQDGEDKKIPGEVLFDNYTEHDVPGGGKFECYPNRDSKSYISVYGLKNVKTIIRGTLRNKGWCNQIKKLVDLGYLSLEESNLSLLTYRGLLQKMIQSDGKDLKGDICKKLKINEEDKILSTMEWLELFSEKKISADLKTPLDVLCHQMQSKMRYAPGERDMLVMNHTFLAEFEDGTKEKITSTMLDYGIKNGDTSMSRTVSLPLAIAVRLVLQGKFTTPGLTIPIIPELYNPILKELEENFNVKFVERTTKL